MRGSPLREKITMVAVGLAVLSAMVVAMYAVWLLAIGQPWTLVLEVPAKSQQASPVERVVHTPVPAAVVLLLAATLLIIGLLGRRLWLAWIGLATLTAFSALFVFGVGGGLLPVAGFLLLLLVTITFNRCSSAP